ncbi:MAG: DUF47 domain-containing protein [Clostridiales bacterium]|nr:DUF47 domain-containing protein [Clostridiales bacterium]
MKFSKKKEDEFFVMFKDFSTTLVEMADSFKSIIHDYNNVERTIAGLKLSESECDVKSHKVIEQLNKSFITPFDREDIFAIIDQLDDLADFIEDSASKLIMYDIHEIKPDAIEMADIIYDAVDKINTLFNTITDKKKLKESKEAIIEVNRLENLGDAVYRRALTKLFRESQDPMDVIKWKDIYEELEETLDACEHLADTVEGVIMKYA